MDTSVGPQILEHISKSVQITSYDVKWIPSSARFVVMGAYARATGCLQAYELDGTELKLNKELETKASIKCGTFGASGLAERHLATGNFEGYLQMWDLERSDTPVMEMKAHTSIVNAIDGVGGSNKGYGAGTAPCVCGTCAKKTRRSRALNRRKARALGIAGAWRSGTRTTTTSGVFSLGMTMAT